MTTPAPLQHEILVKVGLDRAFQLFTDQIGAWWPLEDFSVFGDGTVEFVGRELVERSGSRTSIWAEVTEWDAPHSFAVSWHAGAPADRATDVRVTFTDEDGATRVRLVHQGWERLADPATAAQEYGHGWPVVLGEFIALVDAPSAAPVADQDWFALMHRPGPALLPGESIFESPAFAEHVAFIQRLDERGLLVAAGPLPDQAGAGMTIVRVGPEHGDIDVADLARTDDLCVAAGYLMVTVRPWQVVFAAA